MKKKECPSCAMMVNTNSKTCPICSYEFTQSNRGVQFVAIMLILLFLYFLIF
jgi:RNA polymerase subunit RPABC4/transcription elongation factor Spt4